jgi:hypothetical protein
MTHCDKLPNLDHELDLSIAVPDSVFPVRASVKKVRLTSYEDAAAVAHNLAVRFTRIGEEDRRLLCYAIEAQGRQSDVCSRLSGGSAEGGGTGSLPACPGRPFAAPRTVLEESPR